MKVKYITALVLATMLMSSIKTDNGENETPYFVEDSIRILRFGENDDLILKNVRSTDSVKIIKNKIQQQFGIPVKDQTLIVYDKYTQDSRKLNDDEILDSIDELKKTRIIRLITPRQSKKLDK